MASYFEGWLSPCSGTGSCVVIVDTDISITAQFGLKGDYDGDNDIDLEDLMLVVKLLCDGDEIPVLAADTDGDDAVSMADAIYLLRSFAVDER